MEGFRQLPLKMDGKERGQPDRGQFLFRIGSGYSSRRLHLFSTPLFLLSKIIHLFLVSKDLTSHVLAKQLSFQNFELTQ